MSKFGESILRSCANLATARPWWIILATLLLTALAGYASIGLTVDTSTENILSAELPFRQTRQRIRGDFPAGGSRRRGHRCADGRRSGRGGERAVVARRRRSDVFGRVELAGSSPYFDRYGLLFLSPEQITEYRRPASAGAAAADRTCERSEPAWRRRLLRAGGRGRAGERRAGLRSPASSTAWRRPSASSPTGNRRRCPGASCSASAASRRATRGWCRSSRSSTTTL